MTAQDRRVSRGSISNFFVLVLENKALVAGIVSLVGALVTAVSWAASSYFATQAQIHTMQCVLEHKLTSQTLPTAIKVDKVLLALDQVEQKKLASMIGQNMNDEMERLDDEITETANQLASDKKRLAEEYDKMREADCFKNQL